MLVSTSQLPTRISLSDMIPTRSAHRWGGFWKSLYRFDLQQQFLPDYEVSSWYLSNHPSSHFVTGLMAARPDRDRRYALRNSQLTIHHLHGNTERRVLGAVAELRSALEECFQITLPATRDLNPALQRLIEQSQGE